MPQPTIDPAIIAWLQSGGVGPFPTPNQGAPMEAANGAYGPPAPGFMQSHPKLAGFLANLGPALSALDTSPAPLTPYKQSGLTGTLNALARGGQTFVGAQQNIENEKNTRIRRGLLRHRTDLLSQPGSVENLSPEELQLGQLYGVPSPTSYLGASEQAAIERTKGGQTLSAGEQQAGRVKGVEEGGAAGAKAYSDFINKGTPLDEGSVLSLSERRQKLAEKEVDQRGIQIDHEYEIGLRRAGADEAQIAENKRQFDINRNEHRNQALASIMDKYPGVANSQQMNALTNYFNTILAGDTPKADPVLDSLPNAAIIKAEAARAAAGNRVSEFAQLMSNELLAKYGSLEKIRAQPAGIRALKGIAILSQRGLGSLALNSPQYADEVNDALDAIDEVLGVEKGWSWSQLGGQVMTALRGGASALGAPNAKTGARTGPAPASDEDFQYTNLRSEGNDILQRMEAGTASDEDRKRLMAINEKLRQLKGANGGQ